MKKIVFWALFVLCSALAMAQDGTDATIDRGAAIMYFSGKPGITPDTARYAEIAYNKLSGELWHYNRDSMGWKRVVDISQGYGDPSGDPGVLPKLWINRNDGGLFQWTGAAWVEFVPGADDQTAAEVPFTPASTITATDVQAAIVEALSDANAYTDALGLSDLTDHTANQDILLNGNTLSDDGTGGLSFDGGQAYITPNTNSLNSEATALTISHSSGGSSEVLRLVETTIPLLKLMTFQQAEEQWASIISDAGAAISYQETGGLNMATIGEEPVKISTDGDIRMTVSATGETTLHNYGSGSAFTSGATAGLGVGDDGKLVRTALGGGGSTEQADGATILGDGTGGDPFRVDTTLLATTAAMMDSIAANGGGAVSSVNSQTGAVVLDADDIDDASTTNKFTTAAEISKLAGIEANAKDDQSIADVLAVGDDIGGDTLKGLGPVYSNAYKFLHTTGGSAAPVGWKGNLFLGDNSGAAHTGTGYANVYLGPGAGRSANGDNTVNNSSTIVGYGAGGLMTSSIYNQIFGTAAGESWSGSSNAIFGYHAGITGQGDHNCIFGRLAGESMNGDYNFVAGTQAGENLVGDYNFLWGFATADNLTGTDNVFVGAASGSQNSGFTSTGTIAIGRNALNVATSASQDVLVGYYAGASLTNSSLNVGVGGRVLENAGSGISRSTFLGYSAGRTNAGSISGSIAIGAEATVSASNRAVFGSGNYPISTVYFGKGETSGAPVGFKLSATDGTGTNIGGGTLSLSAGRSTGNRYGGRIQFQGTLPGSSGSSINTVSTFMVIDSSGNVGIGTSSPQYKLSVVGNIQYTGSGTGNAIAIAGRDANNTLAPVTLGSGLTLLSGVLSATGGGGGGGTTIEADSVSVTGTPANYTPADASAQSHFEAIDAALAGAGSTSPGGSDGQIQYNNGGAFGGASVVSYDDANNRLGIGSASPTALLDINNTAGNGILLRVAESDGTGTNTSYIQIQNDATGVTSGFSDGATLGMNGLNFMNWNREAGEVWWATSNTLRASIPSGGGLNVGTGSFTGTTAGVLNVQTGFRVNNAATSGSYLRGNGTNIVLSTIQESDLPARPATDITHTDTGGYFSGSDSESIAQEIGAELVLHEGENNIGPADASTITLDTYTTFVYIVGESGATQTHTFNIASMPQRARVIVKTDEDITTATFTTATGNIILSNSETASSLVMGPGEVTELMLISTTLFQLY